MSIQTYMRTSRCRLSIIHYILYIVLAAFFIPSLSSCVNEEEYDDTPEGNFEALWKILDEHYCFFDYKKEVYGLDWNEVYARYKKQVNSKLSDSQLFEILANMAGELRDGHVNISAPFDLGRYWTWMEDYPSNVSDTLIDKYLGKSYKIIGSISYCILDDNIGYVRIPSFSSSIGSGSIDEILEKFLLCNGIIIDIRGNTGGLVSNAETIAAHFTNEETLVGYMQHKTGTGHSDFSNMEEQWLKPSDGLRWQKKTAVLTNREVYSAANEFAMYMKGLDNVMLVGDKTGGGAGMPFSSELPNGWGVRFSACPMYDSEGNSTEFGIEPDVYVNLLQSDFLKGEDTIIEYARQILIGN